MPLRKRVVEFPLGSGVDQSKYPIPLEGPALASLTNGRIQKSGGVEPRRGYAVVASGGETKRMFPYRGALHSVVYNASDVANAPVRLKALNTGRVDTQGGTGVDAAVSEATVFDRIPITRDSLSEVDAATGIVDFAGTTEQSNPDYAVDAATNLMVIAWQQRRERSSGGVGENAVWAEVRDVNTMAIVTPAERVTGSELIGQNPRCINHNGSFYVVFDNGGGGDICLKTYNQTTRAWSAGTTTLVTDANTTGFIWDAVELTGSEDTCWYLAYRDTTPRINLCRIVGTTIGATDNIAESPAVLSLYAEGSSLWVGWFVAASDLIRFGVRNSTTLASSTAATTAFDATGLADCTQIGIVAYSASAAVLTWTLKGSTTARARSGYVEIPVVGTPCHKSAVALVSRPAYINGILYANVLYDGGGQFQLLQTDPVTRVSDGFATVFTVALNSPTGLSAGSNLQSWRVVAPWLIGVAGSCRGTSTLANFKKVRSDPLVSAGLGVYGFPAAQEVTTVLVSTLDSPNTTNFGANGIDFCRMQFDATDRFKAVEFGQNLVIAGGVTAVFDGSTVGEYCFWWAPECGKATVNAGAGQLSDGSYSHAVLIEYKLANGDVIRSAPAIIRDSTGATSYDVPANDYVDLLLHCVSLTQRFNAANSLASDTHGCAMFSVYRTEANGDVYNRDPAGIGAGVTSLANDPFALAGADYVSGDGTSDTDAVIANYPAIYTTGGQLPNYPAPATDDLVVHRGRLWGISSEDKRELVFTHYKEAGELPGFHPFLSLRIDDGGDCIGLATLDEKLVVFKRDSVYVVHGDGPDRRGVGGAFQITKVHTEHGCRDRRSIVNIPQGIMFASRRGLCLLSRGFQVQYIGGPVEDTESGKEYVSAVALADEEQVYFQVREYAGTGGRTLVYHWDSGAWAVDTVLASSATKNPGSAAYVGGTYYATFTSDQTTYSHTGYSDCGTDWIPLGITTPWLKVSGMQGFGRMWWASLVGERHSAHGLSISVYRDYASSAAQTVTFSEATVTASLASLYQPKVHIKEQVGQAYKLAITTTAPSGSHGRAAVWNGLAFEMGMKGGIRRQPDGRMEG